MSHSVNPKFNLESNKMKLPSMKPIHIIKIILFVGMSFNCMTASAGLSSRAIVKPINNETITGTNVTFIWGNTTDLYVSWWLQVANNTSFSPNTLVIDTTFSNSVWDVTGYDCYNSGVLKGYCQNVGKTFITTANK